MLISFRKLDVSSIAGLFALVMLTGCSEMQATPTYLKATQSSTANHQIPPFGPTPETDSILLGSFLASYHGVNSISFVPWYEKICTSNKKCRYAIVDNKIYYKISGTGSNLHVKGQLISQSGRKSLMLSHDPSSSISANYYLDSDVPSLPPQRIDREFSLTLAQNTTTVPGLYGSLIKLEIEKIK